MGSVVGVAVGVIVVLTVGARVGVAAVGASVFGVGCNEVGSLEDDLELRARGVVEKSGLGVGEGSSVVLVADSSGTATVMKRGATVGGDTGTARAVLREAAGPNRRG